MRGLKVSKKLKPVGQDQKILIFGGREERGGEVALCCKFYSGLGIWGDCTLKHFLNKPH